MAGGGTLASAIPARLGGSDLSTPFFVAEGQSQSQSASRTATAGGSGSHSIDTSITAGLKALSPADPPGTTPADFTQFSTSANLFLTVDTDPATAQFFNPTYVAAGVTQVVGGSAEDPTSYPTQVEFQVDGGAWQTTTLTSRQSSHLGTWVYAWTTPTTEGAHTVALRVTDAVGNVATMPGDTVYVDDSPPAPVTAMPGNPIIPLSVGANYRYSVSLNGVATDADAGPATSGVAGVEVKIDPYGAGWQAATITPGISTPWTIDYAMATMDSQNALLTNPTGQFTVTVRAVDAVGNQTRPSDYGQGFVRVDDTPPIMDLNMDLIAGGAITQSMTLTGVITDVGTVISGVSGGEISFTSDKVTDVYSETVLLLGLNEAPESVQFTDLSGQGNDGVCAGNCPAGGADGRFGTAVAFDGANNEAIEVAGVAISTTNYALSGWFNTTCQDCGLFSVEVPGGTARAATATDRQVYLSGGNLCVDVLSGVRETICSVGTNYADGQWHMVAQVLDQSRGHLLYADGEEAAKGLKQSSQYGGSLRPVLGRAPQAATPAYTGRLDEVQIFQIALTRRRGPGHVPAMAPGDRDRQRARSGDGGLERGCPRRSGRLFRDRSGRHRPHGQPQRFPQHLEQMAGRDRSAGPPCRTVRQLCGRRLLGPDPLPGFGHGSQLERGKDPLPVCIPHHQPRI